MADKKYTFPTGTTSIPPKELHEAFLKYEIVEIPGTVVEVRTRLTGEGLKGSVLKELILNEGTVTLNVTIGEGVKYNIPSTLLNIACDGTAPKVICLHTGFQKSNFSNFLETEYLQAHTNADIRYSSYPNLKHYVYLGEKIKNWGHSPFKHVPSGCVIHVENQNMAKSVLKKCDVFKHYVVVDAMEWKDFPADKLAVTMEEYNPESRILPEQIKMREEKKLRLEAKERKKQEEARKRQKQKMIADLSEKVAAPVFESIWGEKTYRDSFGCTRDNYTVKVIEDEKTGESLTSIEAIIVKDLWDGWLCTLWSEVKMTVSELPDKINVYAENVKRLQGFIEENRALIKQYDIQIGSDDYNPDCPAPGITLPFFKTIIVGRLFPATMSKDVKKIKDFVDKLESLIKECQKDFPYGFTIAPRG